MAILVFVRLIGRAGHMRSAAGDIFGVLIALDPGCGGDGATMALPKNSETPRLRYLQNIVNQATDSGWVDWPTPKESDYTQFGNIIVLFSYMDVNIRRIVEAAEHAGVLTAPWRGRVRKLNITEAEEAVLSLPDWSEPNKTALRSR